MNKTDKGGSGVIDQGAILVNLAIETIKVTGPGGMARIRTWIGGKNVLVIGPSRSGKSSFAALLRFGELFPEVKTKKTIKETTTRSLNLSIGNRRKMELRLKTLREMPGQIDASDHARSVRRRKPHLVVLVLDASSPQLIEWLDEFLTTLSGLFVSRPKQLPPILVLLNKADLVSKRALGGLEKQTKTKLQHLLKPFGISIRSAPVLPSILVNKRKADEYASVVLLQFARMVLES